MSTLDLAGIQQPLTELATSRLEKLEVFSSIASTNTYLMSQPPPAAGRYRVAIADQQTSGRGRHSRRWVSDPGAGLYLSFAFTFATAPHDLGGLTLAIGAGVADALNELGIAGVSLKWPNDIVAEDGKLGGILTEVQSGRADSATVVAGIGLNIELPGQIELSEASDWAHRAVDLRSIVDDVPSREQMASTLMNFLYLTFARFEGSGLAGFMDEWRRRDWLRGRRITVDMPDRQITGNAAGIGMDGSLLVDTPAGQVNVISGSIALAGAEEADP